MRYWIFAVITLAIIVIAIICFKPAHNLPFSPGLPKVGQEATVEVSQIKPDRRKFEKDQLYRWKDSDYNFYKVLIRCFWVSGDKCKFHVYYLTGNSRKAPAYMVSVDYGQGEQKERTVVCDMNGNIIPRGNKIGDRHVPFFDFLGPYKKDFRSVHYKEWLSSNGKRFVVSMCKAPSGESWFFYLTISTTKQRTLYQENQYWRSGDWIWYYNGHISADQTWEARVVHLRRE